MAEPLRTAAFRAEPDAYDIARPQLMGRQSAGHGFLRAAVAARAGGPLYAYTPVASSVEAVAAIVRGIDPAAGLQWFPHDAMGRLSEPGVLYLGDPMLGSFARQRLRVGPAAFSLCGVTHTTATTSTMDGIAGLLSEPVMPWDALICTTQAVLDTVNVVLDAQADYLRWRLGEGVALQRPELPVIPLGVHCDDFQFTAADRAEAREAMALADDEVAALFVGRLIFHGKAHPHAMFRGLQAAAERTGKRVALILCGWFPNEHIEAAFRDGAAQFAPSVRTLVVEGRDDVARNRAWAGSDLFVSLSDSIQETFGLTPVEAMAAGLPCVVTDYNGYKNTVRDGVDGFRVRTWAPSPGMGQPIARAFESGALPYDLYGWAAAASTAVDGDELAARLTALVADADLRRTLGEAGRRRAREVFDWAVVYRQYQALWGELNARRLAALEDPAWIERLRGAPGATASRLDPFVAFGHYPSALIVPQTRLTAAPESSPEALGGLLAHGLFGQLSIKTPHLLAVLAHTGGGGATLREVATALGEPDAVIARAAGLLAKMGMIRLS